MSRFPERIADEAERFLNMQWATPDGMRISLLAANHLVDALAVDLTEAGLLNDPGEITAEHVVQIVADPNDSQRRAITEALEGLTELRRMYTIAYEDLICVAMATGVPRPAILTAAGLRSRSRLYEIANAGKARRGGFGVVDENQDQPTGGTDASG